MRRPIDSAILAAVVLSITSCAAPSTGTPYSTEFFGPRGTLPDALPTLSEDRPITDKDRLRATKTDLITALVAANACDETCRTTDESVGAWKRVDDLLADLPDSVAPGRAPAREAFRTWYACIDEGSPSMCVVEEDEFVRRLGTFTKVVMTSLTETG